MLLICFALLLLKLYGSVVEIIWIQYIIIKFIIIKYNYTVCYVCLANKLSLSQ